MEPDDLPRQSKAGETTAPELESTESVPGSEETGDDVAVPPEAPVLPLRNAVLFPGVVFPLNVGRSSSLQLLEETLPQSDLIAVALQRDPEKDDLEPGDVFEVACLARVLRLVRPDTENAVAITMGLTRIRIGEFTQSEPFLRARLEEIPETKPPEDDDYWKAAVNNLRESAMQLIQSSPSIPDQAAAALASIRDPARLTDFLAGNLSFEIDRRFELLRETNVVLRVEYLQDLVNNQLRIAEIQQKLRSDVENELDESQKRAYLREQLRAIQRELGEEGGTDEEVAELRRRLDEMDLPEEVREQADRELRRLEIIPPQSPDHSVILTYLETLTELPWNVLSEDNLDLTAAQDTLDRDHHGLEKVKRRIVEYLAVRKLNPEGHGPILCFVGPPGVGKTSLGKSIADALGREFTRLALGGIRDEAEIRGHRRTYIGSMPGRIIQELRRAGTRNPVMMLDEIDKLGADFRGDPASALLEVLDPAQNHQFSDRYLDVNFDLSQVLFIATANTLGTIPPPLLDRMETIELPGYTETEKLAIAKQYLIPRQIKENGLTPEQCPFEDEAVRTIISDYTREAGVRNLEREIGSVCRAVASGIAKRELERREIDVDAVRDILGPARFIEETRLQTSAPGVVTGLAYTPVGGNVLHVEALRYPGSGKVKLTGQLGDVMKESVEAAYSLLKSRARELKIPPKDFSQHDVHIHVPAGSIPKDGPSAGITMFVALASLFTGKPVSSEVAMTGEISLRGLVLPIGGLKEKTIAGLRAGVRKVLIPKLNEKDIPELPEEVRERVELVPVETIDEVLELVLS